MKEHFMNIPILDNEFDEWSEDELAGDECLELHEAFFSHRTESLDAGVQP